jgi:hypothetical protein
MKPLAGKTVLFIGIGFYDYEQAIADELRRLGAEVSAHEEMPRIASKGLLWPILRRLKVDVSGAVRRHHEALIETARSMPRLDYVLIIKGEHLQPWFLSALRATHPSARLIAYHWDSMARYPELIQRQALFDRVYTFDHADAQAHPEFRLRPLFFRREIGECKQDSQAAKKYDLSFVGWLHHQRLQQIRKLGQWAERSGLRAFFYLFSGWSIGFKLWLQRQGKYVHLRTLSYKNYVRVMQETRIVVDLPHPLQTGLTMRAVETVGAGRKLITTARDIVHYDFYRPQNILVIDPQQLEIDPAFLREDMVQVDPDIVARYSLQAWVHELFEIEPTAPARPYIKPRTAHIQACVDA